MTGASNDETPASESLDVAMVHLPAALRIFGLLFALMSSSGSDGPLSRVVVREKASGKVLHKKRWTSFDSATVTLTAMQEDAAAMNREEFLARWSV